MCHLCSLVEIEGSEREKRMLSCKSCSNKYHRDCLKSWAQHRDLFHWSSWTCPSCRTCEVCGTSRDPRKFMFCKRCDAAYHCSCQQPQHKNVCSRPYVCPKHTKCHSCGSTVPGNGLSVRWFLGYTCCDACGRLFVKGNYCPVCLKVYRDSESTPMVCCDICQRWVHCHCDGISDEKYLQFQVDGNLPYKCATCRGECYQVKDLEDAVRELWKQKDMADRELIASLRAAAGLPTEEISSIYPSSDDEKDGPLVGRNMKSTLKGLADKSPKYPSSAKRHSKKKVSQASVVSKSEVRPNTGEHNDAWSNGYGLERDMQGNRSRSARVCEVAGKVMISGEVDDKSSRILRIKCSRHHDSDSEGTGKHGTELNTLKPKRLVINIGQQNLKVTKPSSTNASKLLKQQELVSNGHGLDHSGNIRRLKISGKFGKLQAKETVIPVMLGKSNEDRRWSQGDATSVKGEERFAGRHLDSRGALDCEGRDESDDAPGLQKDKDSRRSLKIRIRKSNAEKQGVEERENAGKGRGCKRKRASRNFEDGSVSREDSVSDDMPEGSWMLKKDAKGKRAQIHQAFENS